MSYLSFKLSDRFVGGYVDREPPFGYRDAAGNSIGEIIFLDKYSRLKDDGTKERWHEVCRRVVEGMYSLLKDHAKTNGLPWNQRKAYKEAEEAYDSLFELHWAPPGRGLWSMGTNVVNGLKNSTPLQNCAFISTGDMTKEDPAYPFAFLMDVSMLGVGVGYDTVGASKGFVIHEPQGDTTIFQVPDSREGWTEALRRKINSYLISGQQPVAIDTSLIRAKGERIKTFGGTAPGPEPLNRLMRQIDRVLGGRDGDPFDTKDIGDLANLTGVCVVSGNVRRSATIMLGEYDDKIFRNLKNPSVYPERNSYDPENPGWAWMSNNSIFGKVGQSYDDIIDGITLNGEPGVLWMENVRGFGRMADGPNSNDHRVAGVNPCAEQFLESGEMCTLADLHFSRIPDKKKLKRAIKHAFLYTKAVTLLPTHIPQTNAIMQRNRRIGLSASGLADFMDNNGRSVLREWLDEGYQTVREYDKVYSEWLCVRESIRVTTVKPTGTKGLLVGESPGVHWTPGGEYFFRLARLGNDNPIVGEFLAAGYKVEKASEDPDNTVVVYFPVHSQSKRSERDVSLFEKIGLAVDLQKYWSDNGVSVTLSFDPETESQDVKRVLEMHDGDLKAVSFLPMGGVYPQSPFTQATSFEFYEMAEGLAKVDMSVLYSNGVEATGESGCVNDTCEVKAVKEGQKWASES